LKTNARIDLVLRQLESLPALPAVAAKLLRATGDGAQETATDIARLVGSDPAIAARVLQVARRAEAAGRDVDDLQGAIVRLGTRGVRDVVLALSVAGTFASKGAGDHGAFSGGGFWRHSVAVACCCELLGERVKVPGFRRGDAFVAGLLHDLGKLALHAALPKAYARVVRAAQELRCDIVKVERQVIGIDHHLAGLRLAKRWQLPDALCDVVNLHNTRPDPMDPVGDKTLVHLVTLSDQIARQLHLGFSGNHTFGTPRDLLLDALGLVQADAGQAVRKLVRITGERCNDLGLDAAPEGDLYLQGISDADNLFRAAQKEVQQLREAVKRDEQAATDEAVRRQEQERAAEARTKAFGALSALSRELHETATPRDVLAGLCESAGRALDLPDDAVIVAAGCFNSHEPTMAEFALRGAGGRGETRGDCTTVEKAVDDSVPAWLDRLLGSAATGWLCIGDRLSPLGWLAWTKTDDTLRAAEATQALTAGWAMAMRLVMSREKQRVLEEALADEARRLREAREHIAHDRTLVAVAELAAGAAHEMNNPLMVISGRSQLLYRGLMDVRYKQAALAIHHNAKRLGEMIEELMRYAQPPESEATKVTVKALVDESIKLAGAAMDDAKRAAIQEMSVKVPREVPAVRVDIRRFARAVAAAIENAAEALPAGGGSVSVTASSDLSGGHVVLTIEDDGRGMDDATLERAFDPFFSRKDAGRRRGMGLSAARRLVETGGGTLSLDSREGEGTRAIFTLPTVVDAAMKKSA
jgi:signal transduction histidine kinase